MEWAIFLAITLTVNPAHARPKKTLTNGYCPKIDHRHQFSRSTYQGNFGTCYAFVATALLGEQLCLERKELCGKSLSVVDVSRCSGFALDGGFSVDTFRCALSAGACLDQHAPYEQLPEDSSSKKQHLKVSGVSARHLAKAEKCTKNRLRPERPLEVFEENLKDLGAPKKIELLKKALLTGSSVGLRIDYDGKNAHVVVVAGMRNNIIKGDCELWVRDSDADDDWRSAEDYLEKAVSIFWAKPAG